MTASLRPGRGISKITFLLIALVSAAAFLVLFALRLKLVWSVNSDIGGVEQNVIYSLQHMLEGKPLYSDPADFPFFINQYTPVYNYLCYLSALLSSTGPGDIRQLYIIGRLWTLFFNLLSIGALAAVSYRVLKLRPAIVVTIACCSFIFIYRQGFCARADSMMDCTMLWSVYFFLDHLAAGSKQRNRLIASLLLAVLSVFIKQSGIQLLIILLGFLLIESGWKTFFAASLGCFAVGAAGMAALFLVYGDPFFKNVIGGVDNGISYAWVRDFLWGNGLKTKVILPAIISGYVIFFRLFILRGSAAERFLCFCVLGMFLFNAVVSFKSGSNIQYFYVFTNLSLLLCTHFFLGSPQDDARGRPGWIDRGSGILFTGYLFLLMLANTNHQFNWIRSVEFRLGPTIAAKENVAGEVARFIQSVNDKGNYVFANLSNEGEDLSFSGRRGINNILYQSSAVPALDVLDVSSVKSRVFGYGNFDKALETGKIRFVIEGTPLNKTHIPHYFQLRTMYFRPLKEIGGYTIYEHL